jgi:hypothetical protein
MLALQNRPGKVRLSPRPDIGLNDTSVLIPGFYTLDREDHQMDKEMTLKPRPM